MFRAACEENEARPGRRTDDTPPPVFVPGECRRVVAIVCRVPGHLMPLRRGVRDIGLAPAMFGAVGDAVNKDTDWQCAGPSQGPAALLAAPLCSQPCGFVVQPETPVPAFTPTVAVQPPTLRVGLVLGPRPPMSCARPSFAQVAKGARVTREDPWVYHGVPPLASRTGPCGSGSGSASASASALPDAVHDHTLLRTYRCAQSLWLAVNASVLRTPPVLLPQHSVRFLSDWLHDVHRSSAQGRRYDAAAVAKDLATAEAKDTWRAAAKLRKRKVWQAELAVQLASSSGVFFMSLHALCPEAAPPSASTEAPSGSLVSKPQSRKRRREGEGEGEGDSSGPV
jgi:hypothetical protein